LGVPGLPAPAAGRDRDLEAAFRRLARRSPIWLANAPHRCRCYREPRPRLPDAPTQARIDANERRMKHGPTHLLERLRVRTLRLSRRPSRRPREPAAFSGGQPTFWR
jgi:hypothetical protein